MVEWRPIPGYHGYEASELGEVRPINPRYKRGRGLTIKPWIETRHKRQAARLSLHHEGQRTKHFVHVLVCMAFHGLPPPDTECCHINHDSLDNRACNLKWDTHSVNIEEQWEKRREMEANLDDAMGLARYNAPPPDSDVPF